MNVSLKISNNGKLGIKGLNFWPGILLTRRSEVGCLGLQGGQEEGLFNF